MKFTTTTALNTVLTSRTIQRKKFYSLLIRFDIVGSGAFGNVYKGTVYDEKKGKNITVAIKTLKERNAKIEFYKEALAVARLRHENIIQFLGRCRGI